MHIDEDYYISVFACVCETHSLQMFASVFSVCVCVFGLTRGFTAGVNKGSEGVSLSLKLQVFHHPPEKVIYQTVILYLAHSQHDSNWWARRMEVC